MRISELVLVAALSCLNGAAAQSPSSAEDESSWSSMTDPASRTYPTTITNVLTTTHSPNPTAPVTIDHITLLDPWPTSPDPEFVPFTLTQTALTQRTISFPTAATPSLPVSVTEINSTKVYILWTIQSLDMTPYEPPVCPGPNGCSYPAIKPHSECAKLKLQTRCAAQCLLKDWMWWCTKHVSGEADHVGRVCAATGGTEPWGVELLEPCDHTDMKPGCKICEGYEEEENPWMGEPGDEGGWKGEGR